MNHETQEYLVNHFCDRRGMSASKVPINVAKAIAAASAPYFLFVECLDQLDPNHPTGGLLAKMIDRAHETATGALALVTLGHYREAEVLSRSLLESSVATSFIVNDDAKERFIRFFNAYIAQERVQNQKWGVDAAALSIVEREDHLARIRAKNEALDHYEKFVSMVSDHFKLGSEKLKGWPKLIDMLTELGQRIDYRTVYAAMCSQAHHDAEDILNYFFINSIQEASGLSDRLEREANTFSIFMLLFGIRWFVAATSSVGKNLGFEAVVAEGGKSTNWLNQELQEMTGHLDRGTFAESWAQCG